MNAEIITIWRYGFLAGVLSAVLAFLLWLHKPPKKADSRPVTNEIREVTRQQPASKFAS